VRSALAELAGGAVVLADAGALGGVVSSHPKRATTRSKLLNRNFIMKTALLVASSCARDPVKEVFIGSRKQGHREDALAARRT
jgi:hypothetical protein